MVEQDLLCLRVGGGPEDELTGKVLVLAQTADGVVQPAQGAGGAFPGEGGQRGDGEVPGDLALLALLTFQEWDGIGPVTHVDGLTRLEQGAGVVLDHGIVTLGEEPGFLPLDHEVQGGLGGVAFQEGAVLLGLVEQFTPCGPVLLQVADDKALVLVSLADESGDVLLLGGLHPCFVQLVPGRGGFVDEVGAVVQERAVGGVRKGEELLLPLGAVDGPFQADVLDLRAHVFQALDVAEVGELTGPDDVEAEHVELSGLALQVLEHGLALLVGRGRQEEDVDLLVGVVLVPQAGDVLVDLSVRAGDRPDELGVLGQVRALALPFGPFGVLTGGFSARGGQGQTQDHEPCCTDTEPVSLLPWKFGHLFPSRPGRCRLGAWSSASWTIPPDRAKTMPPRM